MNENALPEAFDPSPEDSDKSGLSLRIPHSWPQQWEPPQNPPTAMVEDGREYHRVLFHDGDVARPRGWHHDNIAHLVELLEPSLVDGAVGLDYASGTGGSSLPLLNQCEDKRIDVTLALTDVMPSWFLTAHDLLHKHPGTHFFLLDLRKPKPLLDTFGGERFDFIVSASTLHLLPEKKLDGIFEELHGMLKPGGTLVFNTGDLEHPDRGPAGASLLHDVYRVARDLLHEDPRYKAALAELADSDPEQHSRVQRAHGVFPAPFAVSRLEDSLKNAGFEKERLEFRVIDKARQDALDFIQVERLTSIAGAIADRQERRALIAEYMAKACEQLARQGEADGKNIRTFWTFGVYTKA